VAPHNRGLTLTDAERRARVVELRSRRWTFEMIGTELDITGQRAGQLYRAALAAIPARNVDEHRAEASEMCDQAIRELLSIAKDPKAGLRHKIDSWHCIRSWEEHRARILGTNAPIRTEVMTLSNIDQQIAELEAELERTTLDD
jgi:hypothetical protein